MKAILSMEFEIKYALRQLIAEKGSESISEDHPLRRKLEALEEIKKRRIRGW